MAFFVALAMGTACSSVQNLSSFQLRSSTSVLDSQGLDQVLVAFYSSGQIRGAGAFSEIEEGFRSMVEPRAPRDHPLLVVWQEHLVQLQSVARDPDANVMELVWVGSELPFQAAVDDAVIGFVSDDPVRAAFAVDRAEQLGISRSAELQILDVAVQNPVLEDDRVSEWMRHFIGNNNLHGLRRLARSPRCGEYTAIEGVLGLGRLPMDDRAELYGLLTPHLADRAGRAELLVGHVGVLPRDRRGAAARELLSLPNGSSGLHRSIILRLDELPSLDRLGLLLAVVQGPHFAGDVQVACVFAAQAMGDPEGELALDEISRSTRLEPKTRELLIR